MHGRGVQRRPIRVSEEAVERNIQQQRVLEDQRRDLASFGKENASLMSAAASQNRIEQQRRIQQQQGSRNEQLYEEQIKKQAYDKKFNELSITQTQALAHELQKDYSVEERKRREIQKICEEAPELRDLEKMLKIAYLNKERAAQYEEKISLAIREQERIQAIEDEMEAERVHQLRQESAKEAEKRKQYGKQRLVLQQQIEEKQRQLEEAQAQIVREKEMVEAIVSKINNEDEHDYRQRKEKQAAMAVMIKNFEEQRRRELEAARAAERAEEERIMQYNRAMDARNEGVAAKKQAKREEDDRILQQIVEETERKRKEEEEFNNLRDMLWEEELEAKRAQDTYERKMKSVRMKEEMIQANTDMMKFKEIQRQREADNEARLVQLMRQKFADDEARERADDEARRNAKLHHMTLIERQKDERRNMYEREKAQEDAFRQEVNQREEYRQKVIQEARKRLLEEHAQRLKGYLPNKVFENRDEYDQYYGDSR